MLNRKACCTFALLGSLLSSYAATAETTLRIAMTASDIPTATGLPNNGFEGMRFLGYPIFEGLVLWDLTRTDQLAGLRPGLAEKWAQDPADNKTWIFHLRQGVKFHDGTDFNADAVIWNLDRYFNSESPQFEPPSSAMSRARVPVMSSYKKIDDATVAITTTKPASYFPYMAVYLLFTSPASFEKAGRDWAKVATLPAAGTGPFRIAKIVPRQEADLARWEGYWDASKKAKVDNVVLMPIPEANSRLAALRAGKSLQVRRGQRQGAARRGRIPAGKAIVVQGADLEFRLGADVAFADERIPAAKSERGLRRECGIRRDRMAGAVDGGPCHARQRKFAGRHGAQHQFALIGCRRHGALFRGR
jgi:peptide/nickel transport system substrate-binding protein